MRSDRTLILPKESAFALLRNGSGELIVRWPKGFESRNRSWTVGDLNCRAASSSVGGGAIVTNVLFGIVAANPHVRIAEEKCFLGYGGCYFCYFERGHGFHCNYCDDSKKRRCLLFVFFLSSRDIPPTFSVKSKNLLINLTYLLAGEKGHRH